jgi:hypothetical protein
MEIGPWICDTCGGTIAEIKDGWVEWLRKVDDDAQFPTEFGLRLVHHKPASPRPKGCQYNQDDQWADGRTVVQDLDLKSFVGGAGLMQLLELIDEKAMPVDDILEMIKRLHVPLYEQARKHFEAARREGIFEPNMRSGFYTERQIEIVSEWAKSKDV